MNIALSAWLLVATAVAPADGRQPRPNVAVSQPSAKSEPVIPGGSPQITGKATWYGTGPGAGHAAAGPALRRALGVNWRGSTVMVCTADRCVKVRLTDWCLCGGDHLIDLSDEDFARLAPLSRGAITVTVTR